MAKFLKIPLTGVGYQPEILISIDQVIAVIKADGSSEFTEVKILLNAAAPFDTVTLQHTPSLVPGSVLAAVNSALTANPGGIVSTLGSPIRANQVPAAQSGQQGRIVITTPATYVDYQSVTFN